MISRLLAWTDGVQWLALEPAPRPGRDRSPGWLAPEPLVWSLTMLGLTMLIVELALTSSSQQPSPFNAVAESRRRPLRFLWLTTGLTVVCLVGLTILLVGGQTLVHLQLRAEDLARVVGTRFSEPLNPVSRSHTLGPSLRTRLKAVLRSSSGAGSHDEVILEVRGASRSCGWRSS